ncbi:hypothetical protein EMGBD1_03230 [Anaerolineaceae bacterium]|nr:hypothetical protein EMGBD1_03230 [Anaerolineaceae bacterium]
MITFLNLRKLDTNIKIGVPKNAKPRYKPIASFWSVDIGSRGTITARASAPKINIQVNAEIFFFDLPCSRSSFPMVYSTNCL